jgi:hypothetical protein
LLQSPEDKTEVLAAISVAMCDAIDKHPPNAELKKIIPCVSEVSTLFKGLRALLETMPCTLNSTDNSHVGFLHPWDKNDEGIARCSLKAATALGRLFKNHVFWKTKRAQFQQHMGANGSRAREIKEMYDTMVDLQAELSVTVAKDDIEAETRQVKFMDGCDEILKSYMKRRPADLDAYRPGGMKGVDKVAAKLCELQWALLKDAEQQNTSQVDTLLTVSKTIGEMKLFQGLLSAC